MEPGSDGLLVCRSRRRLLIGRSPVVGFQDRRLVESSFEGAVGARSCLRSRGAVRLNASLCEAWFWVLSTSLRGLSTVLPVGVVAVVFWARLSAGTQGRRIYCV